MNYVIASVTKQFIFLTFSILLALLAACGDESSSSVSPEPRQCEEQSDDCDDASSSSEKISKNSSSSQKSADKGKSSSSEKNAKESSSSVATKNSSSSVSGDKSSSSVKKEDSSSSVVMSSSSATPKSSSSEEVKQSSSSVVASSSSDEEESSSSVVKVEYFSPNLSYGEFVDSRNHRVYKYRTITGENADGQSETINVMAENLNIGEMVDGSKDQSDDSKIERYCYDNDTVVCLTYGGLYQWAEAMQLPSECNTKSCADLIKPNHQGICPDGWRLLTYNDFYIVVHADDNDAGVKGVRAKAFGGHNYTGYSLVGAGYLWRNTEFSEIDKATYWHYPEEGRSNDANIAAFVGYQTKGSTANTSQDTYKANGFSIRCVMVK